MGKEIELDEMKQIQISVLNIVAEFCEKNKLRYFLAYGTLLGAVRHKGYIPWDDDIDIAMPRPDYEYLLANFNINRSGIKVKKIKAYGKAYDSNTSLVENTTLDFHIGVNIDIFPIDGLPDDPKERIKIIKKSYALNYIYNRKIMAHKKSFSLYEHLRLFIFKILMYPFSLEYIVKKITCNITKYNYDDSNYIAMCSSPDGLREILTKEIFENSVQLEFEGKLYNAPAKYKEYLTAIYGNFMELPPVDQRVKTHSSKAFYL